MTRAQWFKKILKQYKCIAICGGPRTGKSTLGVLAMGSHDVVHGDDFMNMEWSAASAEIVRVVNNMLNRKTNLSIYDDRGVVVEGVAVVRALRKGMMADCVVWCDEPLERLTPWQEAMLTSCVTILADWYKTHKHVPVLQAPKVQP